MDNTILTSFADSLTEPFQLQYNPNFPNVAAVLDDFSVHCFSEVANIWQIDPRRPGIDLDFIKFDFLLVESAWSGNSGKWRYMVTSNSGPKPPLIKLVQECQKRGIPTAFWNKEDPPHFEEFIRTAAIFDYVFTSDAAMIPKYQQAIPNAKVELLRFAAAPHLHSPEQTSNYRAGDIAFAGQYFSHKFPERRAQMETLFPAAAEHHFSIFSRALGGDERYQFPEPYKKYVVGSLPYTQMVEEYRRHKVFLNVNSVVDSTTMCARRVFELGACKTAVVGTDSAAIRSVYDENEVLLSDDPTEIASILAKLVHDEPHRRKIVQRAWRKTLSEHTYADRLEQIKRAMGISEDRKKIHINVFLRPTQINNGIENILGDLAKQKFDECQEVQLSFNVLGGHQVDTETAERVFRGTDIKLETPLVSEDIETFVAYLTSDIRIGKFYLQDLIYTLRQQKCAFAGKVIFDDFSEVQLVEEQYTSSLPEYGWLMSLENYGPDRSFDITSVEAWIDDIELQSNLRCYISDPFELTASADSKTVDMAFNEEEA